MAKDHTLTVLYKNGNVSYPGSANGGNVDVDAKDSTITFSKSPGSDPFSFTDRNLITPPSSDFTQAVLANGNLQITDTDADAGTYNYCLVLDVNGSDVTTDPQIVNKPT
jgi:hypothetical protein